MQSSTSMKSQQKKGHPSASFDPMNKESIELGSRLELLIDDFLIERFSGTQLKMHPPRAAEVALHLDKPWEGPHCGYFTVLTDEDRCRMYYRGAPEDGEDGNDAERTCYAESPDGMHWHRPSLGLHEINGSRDNNVLLANQVPITHNFCPFIDHNPSPHLPDPYKALGGTKESGLIGLTSTDGIHWKVIQPEPLIPTTMFSPESYVFDSQNVPFWSEAENCYICYLRYSEKNQGHWLRSIARTISKDFLTWTSPTPMSFGDTVPEQLYTNQTQPYARAPHIYISLAARFMEGRKVVTDEQARELLICGNNHRYDNDCSDVVLMTSRGGRQYTRTFMEAFLRPGLGPAHWVSRSNYPALGIVQTSAEELSFYVVRNYAQPTICLQRYVLRVDGFAGVNAPYAGGSFLTKPLLFQGGNLVLNHANSAAGTIRVEIQDRAGKPIDGYALADCVEILGDSIHHVVRWNHGKNLAALAGKPIRLNVHMADADLFSLRFCDQQK